jgi:hypothetical protein
MPFIRCGLTAALGLAALTLSDRPAAAQPLMDDVQKRFVGAPGIGEAQSPRRFQNRTRVSYSRDHGTQVTFTAANGKAYLWYPGNNEVLVGDWAIDLAREPSSFRDIGRLCFRYGANTYNPATGQAGGNWSCGPIQLVVLGLVDFAEGDPFGLAKRRQVPFVLSRERADIAGLRRQLQGSL